MSEIMSDAPSLRKSRRAATEAAAARVERDNGVSIGIVIAAAFCVRYHGEDVIAEELLSMAGLETMTDMRRIGADAYDVSALRGVMREIARRKRLSTAKRSARKDGSSQKASPASAAVLSPVGGDLGNAPGTTRAATHNALPPGSETAGQLSGKRTQVSDNGGAQ